MPTALARALPCFWLAAVGAGVAVAMGTGCSSNRAGQDVAIQAAILPAGVVGRVGAIEVRLEQVLAAAVARHLPLRAALVGELDDALFAAGALATGLERDPDVRAGVRARLARVTLSDLWSEQRATPLSDVEVTELTAAHAVELDRPEATRVVHALVLVEGAADAATRAAGRAVAQRVASAVQPAGSAAEFENLARSVGHNPFELLVEVLSPVARDGRVIDLEQRNVGGQYVREFAAAAAALTAKGDKSPVVETPFGFHVLMMLERQEGYTMPFEERRIRLADEGFTARARARTNELVRQLRALETPVVERDVDAVLRNVEISER